MTERHNVVRFAQKCCFCSDRHEVWQLCGLLPPLGGRQYAQAIEARMAETQSGSVHESAVLAEDHCGPDWDDDWDDDDGWGDDDCGLMPNGQCTKAGSEECDWECGRLN